MFEVWSGPWRYHGFSLKRDKIKDLADAQSLAAQLARDGMFYEIIAASDRSLVETNRDKARP